MCQRLRSRRCLQICLHLPPSSLSALYPPTILHRHTRLPSSSCPRGSSSSLPLLNLQFSLSLRAFHRRQAISLRQLHLCRLLQQQQPHTRTDLLSRHLPLTLSARSYLPPALPRLHQAPWLAYSLPLPPLHRPPSPCRCPPRSAAPVQARRSLPFTSKKNLWTNQKSRRALHPPRGARLQNLRS